MGSMLLSRAAIVPVTCLQSAVIGTLRVSESACNIKGDVKPKYRWPMKTRRVLCRLHPMQTSSRINCNATDGSPRHSL